MAESGVHRGSCHSGPLLDTFTEEGFKVLESCI